MKKFKVIAIKSAFASNNCPYFSLQLEEVPKYAIKGEENVGNHDTIREYRPSYKPINKVIFKNNPMYNMIKDKYEKNLPIIFMGEIVTIETEEHTLKHKCPTCGHIKDMKSIGYDATGKLVSRLIKMNNVKIFITEKELPNKDKIIKSIKKKFTNK